VRVVPSGARAARAQTARQLDRAGLEAPAGSVPRYEFEATGADEGAFLRLAKRFLGPEVSRVGHLETGAIELPGGLRAGGARS
jgi:glutamate racemase